MIRRRAFPGSPVFGGGRRAGGGLTSGLSVPGRSLANGLVRPPPEDFGSYNTPRLPAPEGVYAPPDPFGKKLTYQWQPAKLLRDKLYDRMCDWNFHTLEELDAWMPEREWVKAMLDLLHFGWAFDRRGKTLRLRKALAGEPSQSVVELLSGVTVASEVGPKDEGEQAAASVEAPGEELPFSPSSDDGDEVSADDEMVLDAARTMILASPEFVTETCGILARKGRGKTYLAMVMAEELLRSCYEIPFVVLDPTGCWYGLLANSQGAPSDNRVVLLGGERGHYSLPPSAGRLVARFVVECKLPTVLDMSLMSAAEQHGFVADFAEELYLKNRTVLHVFVDEADVFAPQRLDKSSRQHGRCLSAIDNMVRRGRFRGIGNTLVSQRPAVIHKNILSQVGSMFFLQMLAPQDLDAVESWLHTNIHWEIRDACRADIPILGLGEVYFMRGGDRPMFRKFTVRTKTTFDSSHTPKLNEKVVAAKLAQLSPEDRAALEVCYVVELAKSEGSVDEAEAAPTLLSNEQEASAAAGVQHGEPTPGILSDEEVAASRREPPAVRSSDLVPEPDSPVPEASVGAVDDAGEDYEPSVLPESDDDDDVYQEDRDGQED